MSSHHGFRLKKWYLDCVTDAGDAAIVYVAQVDWRGLSVPYSSVLLKIGEELRCRSSLRRFPLPATENGSIRLDLTPMKLDGEWQAMEKPVRKVLLKSSAGTVDWNCLQARSHVLLRVDGAALSGIGYAECLSLTLPPWNLPLRKLRWGRFASSRHSVVWIDWCGEYHVRVVLRDGTECPHAEITEDLVRVDSTTTLELDRGHTLRNGELGNTVLAAVPGLRKMFPRWMRGIHETKWLSRGCLRLGAEHDTGWAIHEVVEWRE